MEDEIVTHLTERGIESLFEFIGRKTRMVLQYTGGRTQPSGDRDLNLVQLSDGFFYHYFLIFPTAIDEFKRTIQLNDIVYAQVVKRDVGSTFTLLFDYKLIYGCVPAVIGKPVEYTAGAVYRNGTNVIPEEIIFGTPTNYKGSKPGAGGIRASQNYSAEDYPDRVLPVIPRDNGGQNKKNFIGADDEPARPYNAVLFQLESDNDEDQKDHYTEIANLNHYDRSFKIRGRVLKKSEMKRFKRKDGSDGAVFSVVIKDETRAIQGTFFNELANRYNDVLQEGKIYSFSDADIKTANRYNTTDNKYELYFNDRSEIKKLGEDRRIAQYHFKLVKIVDIQKKPEGEVIDVMAIVEDPGAIKELVLKTGENKEKRTIKLKDDTGYAIEITLWGEVAVRAQVQRDAIVMFQDVRVKEYNGKTLSFMNSSKLLTELPDHPRYRELILFRNSGAANSVELKNLGEKNPVINQCFMKLADVEKDCETVGENDVNERRYYTVAAFLTRVLGNLYYDSCENDNCMKKVVVNNYGAYDCEKCHKSYDRPKARFMTPLRFTDDTASCIVTTSGEDICQYIFRKNAEELRQMRLKDEKAFSDYISTALFEEFRLRIMAKKDTYNETTRIRYSLVKLTPIVTNPEVYANALYESFFGEKQNA